jgi:hypothetical protein
VDGYKQPKAFIATQGKVEGRPSVVLIKWLFLFIVEPKASFIQQLHHSI